MSDDFAVDPHPSEAGLPEADASADAPGDDGWHQHVRELRRENARRRKENQQLEAKLAEAVERSERQGQRHAALSRRLKEFEAGRLTSQALQEAIAQRSPGGAPAAPAPDPSRALRLLERLPSPLDPDTDLTVDDEGQVALEPAAGERLNGLVNEVVELLAAEPHVAPPPVGGEPPRAAGSATRPAPNAWDPEAQRSSAGKTRAALRRPEAHQHRALDQALQL